MFKKTLLGAGAALAFTVLLPTVSSAQALAGDFAKPDNLAAANRLGVAPAILASNDKDPYGRPRPRTVEEAMRELGSADSVRLASQSDAEYCSSLGALVSLQDRITAAEAEVVRAELAVKEAHTRAEKKAAEVKAGRARTNFFGLLMSAVQIGIAVAMPGATWHYPGMVAAGTIGNEARQQQHKRDMDAYDGRMEVYNMRLETNNLRLQTYDMRLQLATGMNTLYFKSMNGWCNVMKPYHARLTATTTSSYTPPSSPDAPAPPSSARPKPW